MNSLEKELIINLAESLLTIDKNNVMYKKLQEDYEDKYFWYGLYSAMLADITDVIFGSNGHGAHDSLGYNHASWVCGPVSKPVGMSFYEYYFKYKIKKPKPQQDIDKWVEFLKTIQKEENDILKRR
uniref:Uncharacterized protein n=1 Tax=viral metagenome TaxID=1070528 RepID=A0A6M3JEW0_9ZZZZ